MGIISQPTHVKSRLSDLAIFGGEPLYGRGHELHVGRPNVPDKAAVLGLIGQALDRRWLTNNGRYVQGLEARVGEHAGTRYAVAVANCTLGLQLVARAMGLTGEIIMPAWTFIATPHALEWIGLRPVFADIAPGTFHLDPKSVAWRITDRTSAILGAYTYGRRCDVEGLGEVAKPRGLRLFMDAAPAYDVNGDGRHKSFGEAGVFSFHATKMINGFEGGAVVTNDRGLAEDVRRMRNFGFTGHGDSVGGPGINAKLSEAHAAAALVNLRYTESLKAANYERADAYAEGLSRVPGIHLYNTGYTSNKSYIVVTVGDHAGLSRDQLMAALQAEGILARRYFAPGCHRQPPYNAQEWNLPHTEQAARTTLVLPTGSALALGDVQVVCDVISFMVSHAQGVAERLEAGSN